MTELKMEKQKWKTENRRKKIFAIWDFLLGL